MKRYRRRLVKGLAALSLLLCISTVVVWIRSYFDTDILTWTYNSSLNLNTLKTVCGKGGIALYFRSYGNPQAVVPDVRLIDPGDFDTYEDMLYLPGVHLSREAAQYPYLPPHRFAYSRMATKWGFQLVVSNVSDPMCAIGVRSLTMPLLVPTLLFSALPIAAMFRRKLWLSNRSGTCIACGYDLRATPERCPECGTVPKAKIST